jgi:tetratricopeptide (TPR) repeat protein
MKPGCLIVALAVLLVAPAAYADEQVKPGSKVMPRWPDVEIKVGKQVVGIAGRLRWPLWVERVEGEYAWVTSRQVEGWVHQADVLPAEQASQLYTAQINAVLKPRGLAELYAFRGDCHADQKDWPNAIDDYTKAIARGGENAQFYHARALAYLRADKAELALADCDAAIRRDAKLADAFMLRGACWLTRGDPARALADYNTAIALDARAEYLGDRAALLLRRGDYRAAMADVQQGLRRQPNNQQCLALRRTILDAMRTAGPRLRRLPPLR